MISNCGTLIEKVSGVVDRHLKLVIQEGQSYIKETSDFLIKIKNINAISENFILIIEDVAGLYPSTPHQPGLEARVGLYQQIQEQQ